MKYLIIVVIFLSTFTLFYKGLKNDPKVVPSNLISRDVPNFSLEDLNGRPFSNQDLSYKGIKIVNFFASWCPPCKIEHEHLVNLSKNYDVYGIVKKDTLENIKLWFKKKGNPYKKIGFDNDGLTSIEWGVYGLPETFIVSKSGQIIYRHIGPITENNIGKIVDIIDSSL